MRGNLGRACSVAANLLQMRLDLFAARARRLQVLRAVSLYLRLAVLAALDLVAEILQATGELGPLNRCRELLRSKQAPRIQGSRLPVFALGYVEDDGMCVELRRGVTVDGPRGVALEGRGGKLAGQLRGVHIAESGLRVPLQLSQSDSDTLPVRLPDTLVVSDKGSERNRPGAENVASHPARCSTEVTSLPNWFS